MQKLKIGVLTHNYPADPNNRKDAGGFIYDFCQDLSKHADVFVFCPDSKENKRGHDKVSVTWFDWGGPNKKLGNWQLFNPLSIYYFFKLLYIGQSKANKFAEHYNLDFCLGCWALPSAIFAWSIKKRLGIPYATWSLGSDVNKYANIPVLGPLIKKTLIDANFRFANSYLLIEKIEKISEKNCIFLPAITNSHFTKSQKVNLPRNKFNFLWVGRLEKVKGPDLLIDALNLLKNKTQDFHMTIIGGGTMQKEIEDKIIQLDLSNHVDLTGWADEKKISGYMAASDSLVVSSRAESLPLVVIEAAKKSLPLISFDVGDCKRLIKKYKIGIATISNTPVSLADAMHKAVESKNFKSDAKIGTKELAKDFNQDQAINIFKKNVFPLIKK